MKDAGERVKDVPLIPREVLFGNPERVQPKISPDGCRIGFLAPVDGVLNVWVGPADDVESAEPVTRDTGRGIRRFAWPHTGDHVLYVQDQEGDENWRIYATELGARETSDLTPFEDVQARIQHVSPDFPDEILIGLNDRDERYHDVHRVNVRTGEMELVEENPGFAGFITDDDFAVRFATRVTPDGGSEALRPTGDGEWESFIRVSMEDSMNTGHIGFDESGRVAFWRDSRGRDTSALVAIDLDSGEREVLAEHPDADLGGVLRHPTEKHVQAVSFNYTRREWRVIDEERREDFELLAQVENGELGIAARTLDDSQWIVAYGRDVGPTRYYHYNRETGEPRFLFTSRSDLEGRPLAPMRPAVVESRDGKKLVCYYSLPLTCETDEEGSPEEPVPMVLLVHGGPWARDTWGFDSQHQWLANRGYAVLSVNYRGSTGFGKEFLNAGNKEWAGKMHEDLIDAVDWAVDQGITEDDAVAVMGGSYGGYATLVGMTFTPETFACGVDIVGPSNLVTLLESIPPYWKPMQAVFTTRVGDPDTEKGRDLLEERSPLNYVERIRRPLLIAQGENDPRVKKAESDQIVEAMQEKDIPVTYVVYPDEGHGFARPENRMSFSAVAEAFLAEHLGGRFERVGDDFRGASITVPTGPDQVPGLKESLDEAQED
ncbi:MAG: alpha/beta fold hydrolase [Planctomycetota bacterium]